jgi:hypothetical protein
MKPGVYPGLSLQAYLDIKAISNSRLRDMGNGPRECWYWGRHPKKQTPAMLDGTLAGIQILDPQEYLRRIVEWDECVMEPAEKLKWDKGAESYTSGCRRYRLSKNGSQWDPRARSMGFEWKAIGPPSSVTDAKKLCQEHFDRANPPKPKIYPNGETKLAPRNGSKWDAFVAANPDRTVVTRTDLDKAARIARAVRDNPEARQLLSERWRTELTIVWEHESGALCKARPDWLSDPRKPVVLLGDLKLCRSSAERQFTNDAASRGLHAQLDWYADGIRAHYPKAEIKCVLLAVESSGSHDCTVFDVEGPELAAAHEQNEQRIQDILHYEDEYGDQPWPGRCYRTRLDFEKNGCGKRLGDFRGDGPNWDEVDDE